jgi:hypothetical protein
METARTPAEEPALQGGLLMTETTMPAAPVRLRIGAVFSRSFELLFRDFFKFYVLAALAYLPLLATALFGANWQSAGGGAGFAGAVIGMLAGVLTILSQAVILYGAFRQMRGQSFAISDSLRRGLARFFPIIGMIFCMGFAILFGLILLIIPGIIFAVMFYMALPACVIEQLGPISSLRRSAALTKGSRWRIFGILLVLVICTQIAQLIIQFALLAAAGPTISGIATFLWIALSSAFGSIIVAVIYHDLRVAREGIDVERIASVFD